MGREKTTGETTIPFSFRLNPAYNQDSEAIDLIRYWKGQGFSTREIMTDAILARGGKKPEMFAPRQDDTVKMLLSIIENLRHDLLEEIRKRPAVAGNTEAAQEIDGEDERWVNNFTNGFIARQRQVLGDIEDDEE